MTQLIAEKYPKTAALIEKLQPFIILRGDQHIILKFSDGRETIRFNYEKINAFERSELEDLIPE